MQQQSSLVYSLYLQEIPLFRNSLGTSLIEGKLEKLNTMYKLHNLLLDCLKEPIPFYQEFRIESQYTQSKGLYYSKKKSLEIFK